MPSYLTYTPINTSVFPDSYSSARQRLLAHAATFPQLEHTAFPCLGQTPDGESLYTDAIWLGPERVTKILVLLSGTHGVEGFVGSAVGLDHLSLIASGQLIPPPDVGILLVHALTPWGYAWLRRCDADGVDLNRNWIDFSGALPENPGYELLRGTLLLADAEQRKNAFAEFERQHGRSALEIAISGGQYTDPTGSFYGGINPAHGRQITENLMQQYALQGRNLAVVDLHSGLGPYGYGEIICDHAPDSAGARIAYDWYGDAVTLPALGTSSSVPKTGLMDYLWHSIMNDRSCFITLEFGTYPTDQLFEVLLRDHQLWGQPDDMLSRLEHGKKMRQHFCPNDDAWKAMVLFRARQVIAQGLLGLSAGG
jgi:hypothetical protein